MPREWATTASPSGIRSIFGSAANASAIVWNRSVLSRDLDRTFDHLNQVRVHPQQPIMQELPRQRASRRYPIRKVTTPVPVEGGAAGGALPMSAGTSFHGRRKPNGSAFHRRIMAGVQDAAKHAISAMSP
jgi:hypothetical protein